MMLSLLKFGVSAICALIHSRVILVVEGSKKYPSPWTWACAAVASAYAFGTAARYANWWVTADLTCVNHEDAGAIAHPNKYPHTD